MGHGVLLILVLNKMTATCNHSRVAVKLGSKGFSVALAARLRRLVQEEKAVRAIRQLAIKAEAASADEEKGCLMAMVPPEASDSLKAWGNFVVSQDMLAGDGLEDEPHITALYGFDAGFDASQLSSLLSLKPFHVELKQLSRFTGNPDYDVLKFDAISPELESLNGRLANAFSGEITLSKWDYHPHLTVAYVRPGACKHLDGAQPPVGSFVVDRFLYSLPKRQGRVSFSLSGDLGVLKNQLAKVTASNPSKGNAGASASAVLMHAQLQSVGNWIRTQAESVLDNLQSELEKAVKTAFPDGAKHTDDAADKKSLALLFSLADKSIKNAYSKIADSTEQYFKDLAEAVHQKVKGHLAQHHNRGAGQANLDEVGSSPVLGLTLKEHFAKQADDTLIRFKAAVRQAVDAGDTMDQMLQRLFGDSEDGTVVRAAEAANQSHTLVSRGAVPRPATTPVLAADEGFAEKMLADSARKRLQVEVGLMDSSGSAIDKVIQASINLFANVATEETMDELTEDEEEMGYAWLAVLDDRTCERCEALDGNRWTADFEPVGEALEYPGDPPLHFGCRCALVPSNLSEEPADEEKSFPDYLNDFSREEKEAAFGKFNYAAYSRGEITPAQLIGQRTNLMTLEQFRNGTGGGFVGASEPNVMQSPESVRGLPQPSQAQGTKLVGVVLAEEEGHPFHGNQYTVSLGKQDGNEHVVLVKDGKKVGEATGDEGSGDVPNHPDLDNPDANLEVHHNHPDSSPLSGNDIKLLWKHPGISSIAAHGHNGSLSVATANTSDRKALWERYDKLQDDAHTKIIDKYFGDKPPKGIENPKAAAKAEKVKVAGDILRQMHKEGLIKYQESGHQGGLT